MNYFYLDQTNQKQGPVSEQQLKELAAQGIIGPQTPMETDTGHQGTAGQIPGLFPVPPPLPQPQRVPVPQSPFTGNATSFADGGFMSQFFGQNCTSPQAKPFNTFFMVMWICMATVVLSSFLGDVTGLAGLLFPPLLIVPVLLAFLIQLPAGIAGTVFSCILTYKLWKMIPQDIARTSPGKAVGFCFIPFFNLYWVFIAIMGLATDMNRTLQQRGIQRQVTVGLGLTYSILFVVYCSPLLILVWLLSLIPFVGTLLTAGSYAVFVLFFNSAKNGAIAMLEQEGGANNTSA
ncbi:MAG: DUF4339 domain-containing protein [Planctomycetaceae bacterium]|nr:DUF4339 domain-containing protein [Planctomycetaceae bacterium]